MESSHSITEYIDGLKNGNQEAAQVIWERFLGRLIRLANNKLKSSPRKAMNEDDVVQQAFAEFFRQVQEERFSNLNDRSDLWQVLAMLVERRAKDQIRKLNTQKAGGGNVFTESVFLRVENSSANQGIGDVPELAPTPEMAAEFTELFRNRLAALSNEQYRQIALMKMIGHSNREIAVHLKSSIRTIERRLDQIRAIWRNGLDHEFR